MAALSVVDRTKVWRGVMRYWSENHSGVAVITKFDLYDPVANTGVIADTDAWIDAHSGNVSLDTVGFNGALALVARQNLSTAQKTLVFIAVAVMRVSETALRQVLGVEVA